MQATLICGYLYLSNVGAVARLNPIDLVDRRKALDGLDGLGRLGAIVVFDDLDLARAIFQLEAAARVDLAGPKLKRREMGDRRARRKRAGFGADHADFVDAGIRSGGPHERCGYRRCGRIF
jgi:hypothetical protein